MSITFDNEMIAINMKFSQIININKIMHNKKSYDVIFP